MRSEYDCCERVHAHGELSCCTDQIVRAIREHTRAMACATLMLADRIRNESPYLAAHVKERLADADWILAALSASSGGENDAASGRAALPSVPGTPVAADSQAATPLLSADLVTVRRADLVLYLDHSNRVKMASSAWDADLFSAMQHLREAVRR